MSHPVLASFAAQPPTLLVQLLLVEVTVGHHFFHLNLELFWGELCALGLDGGTGLCSRVLVRFDLHRMERKPFEDR